MCPGMSLAYDAQRREPHSGTETPPPARFGRVSSGPKTRNTITASQARAARQREQRRDEQAVSAWLRELAGRPR
jgi:hypothetical protein